MEEALYGEGGYYSREHLPIGEEGDYVTGASLSPLFGRVTARLLERLDKAIGKASAELFEAGYGTGAHLESVVSTLLERTLGRRVRAWDRVARPVPAGVEQVRGLEEIGEGEVEGLIFSYELFDALPVHRLIGRADGSVGELWVDLDREGAFVWHEGEVSNPALLDLLRDPNVSLQPGQVADLSPGWAPLYRELARWLGRGLLVLDSEGMGEEIRVLVQAKGIETDGLFEPGVLGSSPSAEVSYRGIQERFMAGLPDDLPPDPVIEAYKKDVDVTLIRENLKLTPDERARKLMALQRAAAEFRRAGREARARR